MNKKKRLKITAVIFLLSFSAFVILGLLYFFNAFELFEKILLILFIFFGALWIFSWICLSRLGYGDVPIVYILFKMKDDSWNRF